MKLKTLKTALVSLAGGMLILTATLHADATDDRSEGRPQTLQTKIAFKEHRAQVEKEAEETLDPTAPMEKAYSTLHLGQYHNAVAVGILGESLELEDGSIWSISSSDSYKTLNWLTTDVILIKPNHSWFSVYDYVLENQNTGATVRANLSLTPILFGHNSHWIISILGNEVTLEDGSIWYIPSYDMSQVRNYRLNDHIIVGTNDSWWTSGSYPNILINANEDNYVNASCRN